MFFNCFYFSLLILRRCLPWCTEWWSFAERCIRCSRSWPWSLLPLSWSSNDWPYACLCLSNWLLDSGTWCCSHWSWCHAWSHLTRSPTWSDWTYWSCSHIWWKLSLGWRSNYLKRFSLHHFGLMTVLLFVCTLFLLTFNFFPLLFINFLFAGWLIRPFVIDIFIFFFLYLCFFDLGLWLPLWLWIKLNLFSLNMFFVCLYSFFHNLLLYRCFIQFFNLLFFCFKLRFQISNLNLQFINLHCFVIDILLQSIDTFFSQTFFGSCLLLVSVDFLLVLVNKITKNFDLTRMTAFDFINWRKVLFLKLIFLSLMVI